jgi:MSHA biogenesis protein MshP
MCHKFVLPPLHHKPSKQQGSMLVMALFVIIVLGLLGITLTRLLSSSSESIIYDVLGQRAVNAARAGIECAVASQFGAGCVNPINKTFTTVPGLENCSYSNQKNTKSVSDGINNYEHISFTSTGQCQAGKVNVTRYLYVDTMVLL